MEIYSTEGKTKGLQTPGTLGGSYADHLPCPAFYPHLASRALTASPIPSRQGIKRAFTGEPDWPKNKELKMLKMGISQQMAQPDRPAQTHLPKDG